MKSLSVELAEAAKVAFRDAPKTVVQATRIAATLRSGVGIDADVELAIDIEAASASAKIVGKHALARHSLNVADALQFVLRDRLAEARNKTFFGMGICSDESPPLGKRFTIYRFQITWVYVPLIPHVESWGEHEYDETPPVRVERYLLDVVHCPGKDGASVMHVIEKQLERIWPGPLRLRQRHGRRRRKRGRARSPFLARRRSSWIRPSALPRSYWLALSRGNLAEHGHNAGGLEGNREPSPQKAACGHG